MEDPFWAIANWEKKASTSISSVLKKAFIVLPSFDFKEVKQYTWNGCGWHKLQAENVFSLFAMLKFGISADIIKRPIGRLMINYMLLLNLNAEWPLHSSG